MCFVSLVTTISGYGIHMYELTEKWEKDLISKGCCKLQHIFKECVWENRDTAINSQARQFGESSVTEYIVGLILWKAAWNGSPDPTINDEATFLIYYLPYSLSLVALYREQTEVDSRKLLLC